MAATLLQAIDNLHARIRNAAVTSGTQGISPDAVDRKVKDGQIDLINALRTNPNLLKKQTGIVKK